MPHQPNEPYNDLPLLPPQARLETVAVLRAVTEQQDWEGWLLYMLAAVEQTARETTQQIQGIRALMDEAAQRCRAQAPKVYSKDLIELIFTQPYCRISDVAKASNVHRQTASTYLQTLEEIGILSSQKIGRDVIYINQALLNLLST